MKLRKLSLFQIDFPVFLVILCTPIVSFAQITTITDFSGSVIGGASSGSNCIAIINSDGSATLSSAGKPFCIGSVLVTKASICATEYEVSMEVSSSNSGGVGDFALEEMVSRPQGYTSGDLNHATLPVVNRTYFFGYQNTAQTGSVFIANNDSA